MSYTEKETGGRMCPMSFGQLSPAAVACRCIASKCMLWVWDHVGRRLVRQHSELIMEDDDKPQPERPEGVPEHFLWEADSDGVMFWTEPEEMARERSKGYCGLIK